MNVIRKKNRYTLRKPYQCNRLISEAIDKNMISVNELFIDIYTGISRASTDNILRVLFLIHRYKISKDCFG